MLYKNKTQIHLETWETYQKKERALPAQANWQILGKNTTRPKNKMDDLIFASAQLCTIHFLVTAPTCRYSMMALSFYIEKLNFDAHIVYINIHFTVENK